MKNRNLKPLMLTLIIVGLSGSAFAQGERGPRRQHRDEQAQGWERMAERLDLTEAQQDQLKTLRLSFREETLPLKNELREKKARMRTLTTAKEADMKAINQLAEEMGELQTNMVKKHLAHRQEVRKILTDEQRILFDSHRPHRHGRMRRG